MCCMCCFTQEGLFEENVMFGEIHLNGRISWLYALSKTSKIFMVLCKKLT